MTNEEIVADKIKEYEVFKRKQKKEKASLLKLLRQVYQVPQWILSICTQR